MDVNFLGTFQGLAGPIRGAPFTLTAAAEVSADHKAAALAMNDLAGTVLVQYVKVGRVDREIGR